MSGNIVKEDIESICSEPIPWEALKKDRILITGARSYIAGYIIKTLLKLNDDRGYHIKIFALCRNENLSKAHFGRICEREDFELVIRDVTEKFPEYIHADILIHAASPATPYAICHEPINVVKANVLGYFNVLDAAKMWDARQVMLFSSNAVYGGHTPDDGADEAYRGAVDFTEPCFAYRLSKQMCETLSAAKAREEGMDIRIVRPFIVFGPGVSLDQKKHFTDFLANALNNEDIILKSRGEAKRAFCYLSDAVKGFFYVLLKGEAGEAYNITSAKNVCTVKKLAETFAENCKGVSVAFDKGAKEEYLRSKDDISVGRNDKLKALGWRDETDLHTGVSRLIEWGRSGEKVFEGYDFGEEN